MNSIYIFQILNKDGSGEIIYEEPKTIFETDMMVEPKEKELCEFAGLILPQYEKHSMQSIYAQQLQKVLVEFIGVLEANPEFYRFRVTTPMENHDNYRGCSGSPILNSKGEIVTLVNCGDIEKNEIYGISMKACKKYLEVDNMVNEL